VCRLVGLMLDSCISTASGLWCGRLQYQLYVYVGGLRVTRNIGRHLHGHTQSVFSVRARYKQVGVGRRHFGKIILLDALFV
jgi:hypothetical protein